MTSASSIDSAPPSISAPEPELTFQEMLRRAEAMRLKLRDRQQRCEDLGRLPEDTHLDFLQAGFYRVLQPKCFGGYGFSLPEFVSLMVEISRGCIDSGWVLSLIASGPDALNRFSDQTLREIYQPSGDCRAALILKPGGSAIQVGEAYRVQGEWDYCSGCDIATHLLATVLVRDAINGTPSGLAYVLFDRDQFHILRNWDMIGMQGTGSHRVTISEQTIPGQRVLPITGDFWEPVASPRRGRHASSLTGGFAAYAVAVGAARGALDIYESLLRNKKWIIPPFPSRFELPDLQQSFGTAQSLVDTADAALSALAEGFMERCCSSDTGASPMSGKDLRRLHRAGLQCLELAWQAVDLMFRTGGSSSATKQAPMGHYFRGLAVVRTHIGLQYDHVSLNVARLHFGLPALSPL